MELKPKGAQEAYDDIVAHIERHDDNYPNWYCGITSDWSGRLFDEHQVPPKIHPYMARQCYSVDNARAVEKALIKLGCDGAPGGGDENSVYVYAYLKAEMTNP
jgi:hypothetical protein